jgi:2-C-methyl-D-erythritol 4-phosphate cytidylyltransferase/2-C-methyl-D-erythritol 2,4-cyclodiphosphate synthase
MAGCIALVVGAGRGVRFGSATPKQYAPLGGVPLFRHSLAAFAAHPAVDAVRPVIHPDDGDLYAAAASGLDMLEPVAGGGTRQESVRLGLESLVSRAPDTVLIHDAARPFVPAELIARVAAALDGAPGAVPALAVGDTLKRGADGVVVATVDRRGLWRAQTPQGFRFPDILAAHRALAGADLTDDAAVAEQAGLSVRLVDGSEDNLKVTTPDDLARAERLLGEVETRTGFGVDVHRFGPGDHVMLCGVRIPFGQGLAGHSDADVGLHAVCDAIFGAIGAGDIGDHFPPDDPRWRGEPSATFLERAGALVAERGGRIANLDVTIVCERPRIAPHRQAMVARIATILGLAEERVSVKATTTERLGFTGRQEGIAAQAVATVRLSARGGKRSGLET